MDFPQISVIFFPLQAELRLVGRGLGLCLKAGGEFYFHHGTGVAVPPYALFHAEFKVGLVLLGEVNHFKFLVG